MSAVTDGPLPTADRPLRIVVAAHRDPESRATWSGTPAGIIGGLRAAGHEVIGVSASTRPVLEKRVLQVLSLPAVPRQLRRTPHLRSALDVAVARTRNTRRYRWWSSRVAARALHRTGPVDLVIQIGSAFEVAGAATVTFDDLTIPQVLQRDAPDWRGLAPSTVRSRLRAQTRALLHARAATTATPWTARSVREDLQVPEDRVHAVGVGISGLPVLAGRDWSSPRYLFVGKNWEQKNGPVLLAAFASVHEVLPHARLDLVGHHPAVDRPGVTGHGFLDLTDASAQELLAALYARATCLVVPTAFEAAGIAFLEAAAVGIPRIGASGCGAPDMIGPGGVVARPDDLDALAAAMLHLADPERARALGAAGRELAPLFTWDRVASRILQSAGLRARREEDWDHLFDDPAPTVDGRPGAEHRGRTGP